VPSAHKYPPIAYRPPVAVREPLVALAAQTARPVSSIITAALREYLGIPGNSGAQAAPAVTEP
jgi:hypothetical protein